MFHSYACRAWEGSCHIMPYNNVQVKSWNISSLHLPPQPNFVSGESIKPQTLSSNTPNPKPQRNFFVACAHGRDCLVSIIKCNGPGRSVHFVCMCTYLETHIFSCLDMYMSICTYTDRHHVNYCAPNDPILLI